MANDDEIRPSWVMWFIGLCFLLMFLAQVGVLLMAYEATGIINGKGVILEQEFK